MDKKKVPELKIVKTVEISEQENNKLNRIMSEFRKIERGYYSAVEIYSAEKDWFDFNLTRTFQEVSFSTAKWTKSATGYYVELFDDKMKQVAGAEIKDTNLLEFKKALRQLELSKRSFHTALKLINSKMEEIRMYLIRSFGGHKTSDKVRWFNGGEGKFFLEIARIAEIEEKETKSQCRKE